MKRLVIISFSLLLLVSFVYAQTMEAENPVKTDEGIPNRIMLCPKISYVGSLALGVEIGPLVKLLNHFELITEANWVFWNWNGAAGFGYGETNLIYNHQIMNDPMVPLDFFFGGGLIYGSVVGNARYRTIVGKFSGGSGYSLFVGVTGKTDPYIWFAQLKYATAPLTLSVIIPGLGIIPDQNIDLPTEALGPGIEFGIRFPF